MLHGCKGSTVELTFPDPLLFAPAVAHHQDGSLGSQEGIALPNRGSSPSRCSVPNPLRHSCPVKGDRRFPCPSFPPRSARAVAESGRRGRAGNVKERLLRLHSSSGLGSHTPSILRHPMTNNTGKRVFL